PHPPITESSSLSLHDALPIWMAGGRNLWFSVMALAIETFVMNRTMVAGAAQLQLLVISDHYEEIRQALLCEAQAGVTMLHADTGDRKSTRLNSSHVSISYAVF